MIAVYLVECLPGIGLMILLWLRFQRKSLALDPGGAWPARRSVRWEPAAFSAVFLRCLSALSCP